MITVTDEIKNNWKCDIVGFAQELQSLKATDYPAWTLKLPDGYGVAIPYDGDLDINETFANAKIYSSQIIFNNAATRQALILKTASKEIESPFAALCAELIAPGKDGTFRAEVLSSPVAWWQEWKELLGNRNIDDRVYDVLGELCVLKTLITLGEDANWNGPSGASYDIESETRFVEVKSTIVRDRLEITISNQFQLEPPGKPLNLFLCQFEPSVNFGVSINSVVSELSAIGYNIASVNEKLSMLGFEEGKSARNKTFLLHSMLKYDVDSSFPRISPASFADGVMPAGITKITYTVDLSAMTPVSMM